MKTIKEIISEMPEHLKEFVVEQISAHYQPMDHAVWRYTLRQLKNFLGQNAHDCYLDGLKKTGITVDEIPSIETICQKLQAFGWSAVPVSGFIPPAAFMEMQSLGILPIATDMRSLDHVLYTPAPDIVHEAAGHAPILIHPEFAQYLKQYASVAKNAIVSSQDLALYEAIRELSDIKEHPDSTPEEIEASNQKLNRIISEMTVTSEATLLGRMNWWTAEYGLIGDLNSPKIYGAGLLSSYGESKECLKEPVKKIPLSIDCVNYSYDITEPQPQLFVASSFSDLSRVLGELSNTLSYKKGGIFGLQKAIEAKTVNTLKLNSGLEISGKIVDFLEMDGECLFYRLEGPTQICIGGKELKGHDKNYHSHGFSSPLGYIEGFDECPSWASDEDLINLGLVIGQNARLTFESGIVVEGELISTLRSKRNELCLLSFKNCHVHYNGKSLFLPEWGTYDMAVGSKIESVYAGPADRKSYGLTDRFAKKTVPPRKVSIKDQELNLIYKKIRELRKSPSQSQDEIKNIFKKLSQDFSEDWLATLELLEICEMNNFDGDLKKELTQKLFDVIERNPKTRTVIEDGIKIASQNI